MWQVFLGYIAPNYKNLELELSLRTEHYYGLITLAPLLKALTLGAVVLTRDVDVLLANPAYNAGTFLRGYVLDFGWIGAVGYPFILGVLSAVAQGWYLLRLSPTSLVCHALVMVVLTFAFWFDELQRIQFWYVLSVIWFFELVLRRAMHRVVLSVVCHPSKSRER